MVQTPNIYGTYFFIFFKLIDYILQWAIGSSYVSNPTCHFIAFWGLLAGTAISLLLVKRYGECDFERMRKHMGPYGAGIKRFWSKQH